MSTFAGGQIWVEEDGGNCVMDTPKGKSNGKLLEVAEGPVVLEAQTCYHCTLSWEGRRLVLVAYVVAGLERLAAERHALVEGLGFQLPTPSHKPGDETSEVHLKKPAKQSSVAFRPEPCGN